MSYINISFGAATSTVSPSAVGIGCIIGVTAENVGIIKDVTISTLADTANLPSGSGVEGAGFGQLGASDPLYKAAMDYFAVNPTGTLVLLGIDPNTTELDAIPSTPMTKIDDNNWISGYSPVATWVAETSVNYFKVKLTAAGAAAATVSDAINTYDTDTWYFMASDATAGAYNEVFDQGDTPAGKESVQLDKDEAGNYTGGITFVSTVDAVLGIYHTVDSAGTVEPDANVAFNGLDKILCKVTTNPLGYYMGALAHHSIDFDAFCFGYDAELAVGVTAATCRYQPLHSPTAAGTSNMLYDDIIIGSVMAAQLFGMGQRCVFFHGMPDKIAFGGDFSTYATAGGTLTTDQLHDKIGANDFVSSYYTMQPVQANAVESGVAGMASFLGGEYRETMTYRVANTVPHDDYPSGPVAELWQDIRVNPYIQIRATGTSVWGSNYTHGTGKAKFLNFVMCRNILANKIEEALYGVLFKRKLHIDMVSVDRIKETIKNVIDAYTGKYCDGFGSISIPLEEHLRSGNQTAIDAAKEARTVGDISIGFLWDGDVEFINVSGFYGE